MDYANMTMNYTNTLIMNNMIENQVKSRNGVSTHKKTSKTATTNTSDSKANPALFAYTATVAQRNAYRDAYISTLAKRDTALAAGLRLQLGKYDYHTIYGGLLSGTGLINNNLADALAAYTVLGWMIVNGVSATPPAAQVTAVRRQWANALSGSVFMQDANQRRQTAEELKIKMVLLHAGWQDAQKLRQSTAYANAIDAQFRSQLKLQLQSMKLSTTGLAVK